MEEIDRYNSAKFLLLPLKLVGFYIKKNKETLEGTSFTIALNIGRGYLPIPTRMTPRSTLKCLWIDSGRSTLLVFHSLFIFASDIESRWSVSPNEDRFQKNGDSDVTQTCGLCRQPNTRDSILEWAKISTVSGFSSE